MKNSVYFLLLFIAASILVGFDLKQGVASAQGINNTVVFGNFTVDKFVADGQNITGQNVTIHGNGNITMSGNITLTIDNQTEPMDIEELLLSGDLDLGCRRCHELGGN